MKIDTAKIETLAAQVAAEDGLEVVDLSVGGDGARTVLRIFVDREGGIRLSECEAFSRKMSAVLDVEDPVEGAYVLEVSSPGVNRRLSRPAHYARERGRTVRVTLSEPIRGRRTLVGTLGESDAEGFGIDCAGEAFRVPYAAVRRANIEVTQDELFAKGKKKK